MYGANPWATVPYTVASASSAPARGLLTLTTAGQNTLTLSDIKIGSAEITEEQ